MHETPEAVTASGVIFVIQLHNLRFLVLCIKEKFRKTLKFFFIYRYKHFHKGEL